MEDNDQVFRENQAFRRVMRGRLILNSNILISEFRDDILFKHLRYFYEEEYFVTSLLIFLSKCDKSKEKNCESIVKFWDSFNKKFLCIFFIF